MSEEQASGSRWRSVLLALGIGSWLGWKTVTSVQSGLFTRAGVARDVLRDEEPIWFWSQVALTGGTCLLLVVVGVAMLLSGRRASTSTR